MSAATPRVESLARLLAQARVSGASAAVTTLAPDLQPADMEEAYAVQQATLRALGTTCAGWKIGSKSLDGPVQGSALPAAALHRGSATLEREPLGKLGLELEVAFTFKHRFDPAHGPYAEEAVLDAIESVHAAIEIVTSRFVAWPNVDKLWQLADLQNHGALIVGDGVPYDAGFPFVSPDMRFTFEGDNAIVGTPGNPAGDPRRLLAWLVNHCVAHGITLEPGRVVTCGSYTGMYFPKAAGVALGQINGLPPVKLTLV